MSRRQERELLSLSTQLRCAEKALQDAGFFRAQTKWMTSGETEVTWELSQERIEARYGETARRAREAADKERERVLHMVIDALDLREYRRDSFTEDLESQSGVDRFWRDLGVALTVRRKRKEQEEAEATEERIAHITKTRGKIVNADIITNAPGALIEHIDMTGATIHAKHDGLGVFYNTMRPAAGPLGVPVRHFDIGTWPGRSTFVDGAPIKSDPITIEDGEGVTIANNAVAKPKKSKKKGGKK